jgi:hypothetical protein
MPFGIAGCSKPPPLTAAYHTSSLLQLPVAPSAQNGLPDAFGQFASGIAPNVPPRGVGESTQLRTDNGWFLHFLLFSGAGRLEGFAEGDARSPNFM